MIAPSAPFSSTTANFLPLTREKILREQKHSNLRFGDAGLENLGLLSDSDIQFALARQSRSPYLGVGDKTVTEEVVAAFQPFSPFVEELRALRTQLMLRWFGTNAVRKGLAIVSPVRGERGAVSSPPTSLSCFPNWASAPC